jgi:inward rectifier potassium channel
MIHHAAVSPCSLAHVTETLRRRTGSARRPIRYRSRTPTFADRVIRGQAFEFGGDGYFALLTRPWWQFCLAVSLYILVINAVFAVLYMLDAGGVANTRPGSFEDAFFFSVQTLATIGYGTMAPVSRFSHIVVTFESILGILAVGSFAGIAFARLSRPTARVLFSEKIVVRPRNGVPHLQFRVANWRTNLIIEATLRVYVLVNQRTTEGEVLRTPLELKLVRSSNPVFFLTWTAMHAIDESSPFFGDGAIAALAAEGVPIYASLTGYDQTLGQIVHAYAEYAVTDIVPNARFADVITLLPGGVREIDFSRFDDVELLRPPAEK